MADVQEREVTREQKKKQFIFKWGYWKVLMEEVVVHVSWRLRRNSVDGEENQQRLNNLLNVTQQWQSRSWLVVERLWILYLWICSLTKLVQSLQFIWGFKPKLRTFLQPFVDLCRVEKSELTDRHVEVKQDHILPSCLLSHPVNKDPFQCV